MDEDISGPLSVKSVLHSDDGIDNLFARRGHSDHKPLNEKNQNQRDRQKANHARHGFANLAADFVHTATGMDSLIECVPHRLLKDRFFQGILKIGNSTARSNHGSQIRLIIPEQA